MLLVNCEFNKQTAILLYLSIINYEPHRLRRRPLELYIGKLPTLNTQRCVCWLDLISSCILSSLLALWKEENRLGRRGVSEYTWGAWYDGKRTPSYREERAEGEQQQRPTGTTLSRSSPNNNNITYTVTITHSYCFRIIVFTLFFFFSSAHLLRPTVTKV